MAVKRVIFCNIWFNSRIADTLREMRLEPEINGRLDRITSSHYALLFRDIHVLQRKLYTHFIMSKSNIIILIEN